MNSSRALDLVLAIVLLPFAIVLGLLIALAIWIDSPGPIIYRCRRVGYRGVVFEMLKFRKMRHGACGPSVTAAGDERFTPIGRILSITRLDELPQLWNVLRGQMRLVGPRPEAEEFVHAHRAKYETILSVVPGITGLAQLEYAGESALLGQANDPTAVYLEHIFPHKIELDLEYIVTRSLRRDVAILGKTLLLPFAVLVRRCRAAAPRSRVHAYSYGMAALVGVALFAAFISQAGPVR